MFCAHHGDRCRRTYMYLMVLGIFSLMSLTCQVVIVLCRWFVLLVATELNLHVWHYEYTFYNVRRFDPDDEFWHSSLITERVRQRVVCSSTGTTYKLIGKIVKPLVLAQGIAIFALPVLYCVLFLYLEISLSLLSKLHKWYTHELFLRCDASAERGNATVSRLSVRPSVRDV